MSNPPPESARFTVLLVCTGNICRSAFAERLGRAYLDEVMGHDADQVRLASAGTRAVVDSAMHPDSVLVLSGLGADAGDFRARQLVDGMVTGADLTLTMTRAHRQDVLHRDPRALARTFTLREAAELVERTGDVAPEGATLPERARNLVSAMAAARFQRRGGEDDDVSDPIGLPVEVHQEVGEAIAGALLPLLRRIVDCQVSPP